MYQTDFEDFTKIINDLCVSVNRPCNNDLVRVFWEDLKSVPFPAVKLRAQILRGLGKTKFTSNDLRPTEVQKAKNLPVDQSATHRLTEYVLANRTLTPTQLRMPWKYFGEQFEAKDLAGDMVHNHGVNITGVIVPADGDHPGYRVTLADMQLGRVA